MSRVRMDEASGASAEAASNRCWPVPPLDFARQRDRQGTLIRQKGRLGRGLRRLRGFRRRRFLLRTVGAAAAQVPMLAVEVIETAFLALLMAAIGVAELLPPGLLAAGWAAIALSTVAMPADEEHGPASCQMADPLPELEWMSCRCHDDGKQWRAGQTAAVVTRWNQFDVVCATLRRLPNRGPRRSNGGVPNSLLPATADEATTNTMIDR